MQVTSKEQEVRTILKGRPLAIYRDPVIEVYYVIQSKDELEQMVKLIAQASAPGYTSGEKEVLFCGYYIRPERLVCTYRISQLTFPVLTPREAEGEFARSIQLLTQA